MNKKETLARSLYHYIHDMWELEQRIPTQREMASACETSLSTINDTLSILEAKGRIVRERYKKGGIRFVEAEPEADEQVEEVYQYIRDAIDAGAMPTQTEIAGELYISRREVRRCLIVLETLGRITRIQGKIGYQVVNKGESENVPHNDTDI